MKNSLKSISRMAISCLRVLYYKILNGQHFQMVQFAVIGKGTKLLPGKGSICLGKGVYIENCGYVSTQSGGILSIGARTFINRNCYIACRDKISIGENCIFGPNVSIYDHNHEFSYDGVNKESYRTGEVQIGRNCWIGDGVIILKSVHIGDCCVIGAGSVVSEDIPDHSLVTMGRGLLIQPLAKH